MSKPAVYVTIYDYYTNTLKQLSIKNFKLLFNPFFWPIDSSIVENEGATAFFNLSKIKKKSALSFLKENIHSCLYLLYRYYIKRCIKGDIICGEINATTDVFLYTWLKKSDIQQFLKTFHCVYWGGLASELIRSGKKIQFIIQPTDGNLWDSQDIANLTKNGCLCIQCLPFFTVKEVLFALSPAATLPLSLFVFKMRRFNDAMLFAASLVNTRYLVSLRIFHELSHKLKTVQKQQKQIKKISKFLIPWESHPEQKAIIASFRSSSITVWGYVHSGLAAEPNFLSRLTDIRMQDLYPDKLFVHGRDYAGILSLIGWDRNNIEVVQTMRFSEKRSKDCFSGHLFLPYSKELSKKILLLLSDRMKQGMPVSIKTIRPHPVHVHDPELNGLIGNICLSQNASLDAEDVWVGGFSSVIFEALELGCSRVFQITVDDIGRISEDLYPSILQEFSSEGIMKLSLKNKCRGAFLLYEHSRKIIDFL